MIKPRKVKASVSSSNETFETLDILRKEAINMKDPIGKLAKIKEISACTVATDPVIGILMATRLAFFEGFGMLLSMDFATERVKEPFSTGDLTFSFWQSACEWALKGAEEHKSVVCAAMFAELTYIIYGAPTVNYLKVLERLQKHRWELWRDPAKDVQGRWEPALTACEQDWIDLFGRVLQPLGDSVKDRVEQKKRIVGSASLKCKACDALDKERKGGPLKGPIGMLMRMDERCPLLTNIMRVKLWKPQEIARKLHGAFGDPEEREMAAKRKALREQEERSKQVRQDLEAIQKAEAKRPGKFRTRLPEDLYIKVHADLADQQKAAEEALKKVDIAQKPAAKEATDEEDEHLLFFAMRTVEAPKLAAAAQRAAELQAKEVKQYIKESYEGLTTEEEKIKKQQSLQEVPASAVLQAIEQEKNRRDPSLIDEKAKEAEGLRRLDESKHAKELLAGWSEAGRPQAVADILAGSFECYPGPLMEEYVNCLAAPALEQLCKAQRVGAESDTNAAAVSHEDFIKVAVEGQGLLWEGDLPGEFRAPSKAELTQAIQQSSRARNAEMAESSGAAASMHLAAPQLHPMVPAVAGRSDLAAPLHDWLQQNAQGARHAGDMLRDATGRSPGEVLKDFHELVEGSLDGVDKQEVLGEAAAAKARGSNPSGVDWSVKTFGVVLEDRLLHEVHCDLKKYSRFPCQEKQMDPNTAVRTGRLRARLLLILRYMLWRLEAYRCRACWDTDAVSEPGAVDPLETVMLANIKQVCEVLRADSHALLLNYGDWVYAIGPRCSAAEAIPAIVDRVEASRYRFYAAADGPGRACGPANIKMFVLGIQSSTTCSCNAATAAMGDADADEDWTAHESSHPLLENGVPMNSIAATAAGPGDSSNAAPEAAQIESSGGDSSGVSQKKWLGLGPSPLEYPDMDEYERRDPITKEELLQDIFDGLEMLQESKLLTPWLVSYMAAFMLASGEACVDGMNWLQLHWEHMAFLPLRVMLHMRDIVFDYLAMNSELLKVSCDVDVLLRAHDHGCFVLADGQKNRFCMTSYPLTPPLEEAVLCVTEQHAAQCPGHVECGPRTKAAGESDKDRNEEKAADCQVVRSSASAGVPEQALANSDSQSAVVELAQELVEVAKRPEDFSILFTDMLFRTAGRANLLRVPSTYHLKPGAAEILRARILRATACFHIAYREKVRLNQVRQLAADIMDAHLRFAEVVKAEIPHGGIRVMEFTALTAWMDRVDAAQQRFKELGWQEQVQQSEVEVVILGLPVTILKEELKHLFRKKQSDKGVKPEEDVHKKLNLLKSCEEASKKQQEKHHKLLAAVERWRTDASPDSRKKETLERNASDWSFKTREENKRILEHQVRELHTCFRNTLQMAFRADVRIAAARLAALRILRTCEAELTVCFGERLEKWLLEGLKITLQKAAREHFERRQQAILADLMQAEDKQKASFAKKAARKASKVKVPTMNASLPTEKPDEDAQAPAVLAMAPAAAGPEDTGKDAQASAIAEASSGEAATGDRLEDQSCVDTAEQWFEAATISAEAAELGGEEEEEQPEAASPAEPLPVVALETAEAGDPNGFEDVQKGGKKKRKKNKKKAAKDVELEPDSVTASSTPKWWTLETAAEEDRVDDWQMAKPRRQQQKPRGNGVAAPEQPQQEQTNGHSQAPAPSLPQPQPREEVASQGPPQQSPRPAAAPYSRGVPAGAMGDQGTATKRPLSTMGCLKCQDPSHKLLNCPDLQGLPSYVLRDIKLALVEGDAQRVQLLLTRPPTQTCHHCDLPGHSLYNCPQLVGMPSRMRDDLRLAFVQANVKQKCEILAHWKRMQAERAGSVSDRATVSSESSSARPQPSAQSRAGRMQPPPPPPLGRTTSGPESNTWHRQDSARLNGTDSSSAVGVVNAAEDTSGRPQPRGAVAEPAGVRSAPHRADLPFVPQAQGQPITPQPSMQAARAAPSPVLPAYQLSQHAYGPAAPVGGVPLPVPLPPQRTSPAPQRTDSADNLSSIMDLLCPQPSPSPSPSPGRSPEPPTPVRTWARLAEGEEAGAQRRREENDLQTAIQASMHQKCPVAAVGALVPGPNGQLVVSSSITRPQPTTPSGSGDFKALVVATPGLQNQIGEYNCFLNVIIQSLWNCRHFRAPFKAASAAFSSPQSNAVVAALADLFATFEKEEQQLSSHSVVAPTRLREALDALNSQHFQIGEMSDAAEVLEAIYDSLAAVLGGAQLVDSVFGLRVSEAVHCGSCGRDTHHNTYTQFFHTVPATALRLQAMISGGDGALPPLGRLLGDIEAQDQKSCDTDEGGCGERNSIQHLLEGAPPRVFTVQLAWESHCESTDAIRDTLSAVQEEVDLAHIYKAQESRQYRLRSMVCYYGAHYHAFVHTAGRWIMFDDANTSVVGDWDAVLHKCQLGKIQPSVLFFEELLGG